MIGGLPEGFGSPAPGVSTSCRQCRQLPRRTDGFSCRQIVNEARLRVPPEPPEACPCARRQTIVKRVFALNAGISLYSGLFYIPGTLVIFYYFFKSYKEDMSAGKPEKDGGLLSKILFSSSIRADFTRAPQPASGETGNVGGQREGRVKGSGPGVVPTMEVFRDSGSFSEQPGGDAGSCRELPTVEGRFARHGISDASQGSRTPVKIRAGP
jgi:hypothetical protein